MWCSKKQCNILHFITFVHQITPQGQGWQVRSKLTTLSNPTLAINVMDPQDNEMDLWTWWMFQPCFSFSFNPFLGSPPLLHREKGSGALVSLKQAPVRALGQNITMTWASLESRLAREQTIFCENSKQWKLKKCAYLDRRGKGKQEIWRRKKNINRWNKLCNLNARWVRVHTISARDWFQGLIRNDLVATSI